MNIKVLFFASFKEQLNCEELLLNLNDVSNIAEVCQQLSLRGSEWESLFAQKERSLMVSINQEMASLASSLNDGDEVAFFPPVTGG